MDREGRTRQLKLSRGGSRRVGRVGRGRGGGKEWNVKIGADGCAALMLHLPSACAGGSPQ